MKSELLFEELSPTSANVLSESSDDGKDLWLNGIFMQAEVQNRNKRVYPRSEIENAVRSLQTSINENNGVMGELDHPQTISLNLDRVSHLITEVHMEGNNAIGKAKILNTPMGNIAREIIKSGFRVGVSTRGTGNVNEGIVEGYNCVTVDIVATPSAQGATPSSIYESLDTKQGRRVETLAEAVRNDPAAQKYFVEEMRKWMKLSLGK